MTTLSGSDCFEEIIPNLRVRNDSTGGGTRNPLPASCPTAGGSVVATRVRSCTFTYDANHGATQQGGFVWMQIQIGEAGESVTLAHGTHVDNLP